MAEEWTRVPSYADALAQVLGPGVATPRVAKLADHAEELRVHGRRMFERWLELVPAEPAVHLTTGRLSPPALG